MKALTKNKKNIHPNAKCRLPVCPHCGNVLYYVEKQGGKNKNE